MNLRPPEREEFDARFPRTLAVIDGGRDEGLHRGCQIYISLNGEPLADVGIGQASVDSPMTRETINLWRSAGKPMTAAAILKLVEAGRLDLDAPVKQSLPAFPDERVTLRHLLIHSAGIPNTDAGWPQATWAETIERVCQLDANPEGTPAYCYVASWFLLGEILRIQTDTRASFSDVLSNEVFAPLQMSSSWNGMSLQRWRDVEGRLAVVESVMLSGRRREEPLHLQPHCAAPSPGGNLRSTARDVGRFYEGLGSGRFFERGETLSRMLTPHRHGVVDGTFRAPIEVGLGVLLTGASDHTLPYGFGRWCSAETFGHGGAQCAMAFCDPAVRLVVAWAVNGLPGEPKHQQRNTAINTAIYEDLGLTSVRTQ